MFIIGQDVVVYFEFLGTSTVMIWVDLKIFTHISGDLIHTLNLELPRTRFDELYVRSDEDNRRNNLTAYVLEKETEESPFGTSPTSVPGHIVA